MRARGSDNFFYGTPFWDNPMIRGMSVGSRIKKLRLEMGLDQGELARAAKIKQSTLSDLERGDSQRPRGDTLVRLASILQVDQEWLMTGNGLPTQRVTPDLDEAHLLAMYRSMTDGNRAALIATAKALLDSQPPTFGPGSTTHKRPPRHQ